MQTYTDYLIIITPPENIINEISRYKRASVNLIGHFEGMHSRPNIIITEQVRCKAFLADAAIMAMEQRLGTMPPIELLINGFSFIAHSPGNKTIYASVKQTPQTERWFKLLTLQLGIKIKNFVPKIPVAQNIPPSCFYKLWANFKDRELHENFMVNSLTILQRETYVEYREWRVYKELFFANRFINTF